MRKPHLMLLLVALIAGIGLRINGISWGLPDGIHASYSYHPDEAYSLAWASDLYRGEIIPKQFMYGGTFFFSTLEASARLAASMSAGGSASVGEKIVVARYFSLLCAGLTILLTYCAGATLYSRQAGGLAALILALAPGHVVATQVARPDALFTLLLAANVLLAARLVRGESSANVNVAAAGGLLGLAVATRFPAGVWWFGHVTALYLARAARGATRRTWFTSIACLSVVACLGYLLASPHSLSHSSSLLAGLQVQYNYQRGGEALAQHPAGWHYGSNIMAQAIGYGFYGPALIAIAYACLRRTRSDVLAASFVVPYFLLLTCTHWVVVRYFTPLLPVLAILLGRMLDDGLGASSVLRQRVIAAAALVALAANALALGIYDSALRAPDSRDQALQWLIENVPSGARIGVMQGYDGDVYFHPPAIARFQWSSCVLTTCDVARFFERPSEVLIIADAYLDTPIVTADGERTTLARALAMQSAYVPTKRFAPLLMRYGYDVRSQFSAPDMRHPLPTLTIYLRRPQTGTAQSSPGSKVGD